MLEAERLYLTLPVDRQWQMDFRTNLPMVQLLLSRVYLYMEDWNNAALYAQKVINDWSFSLQNLNSLPEGTTMEPYFNFISSTCTECIWLYGSANDVYYFLQEDWNTWDDERSIMCVSEELLNSYVDGDLRKEEALRYDFTY